MEERDWVRSKPVRTMFRPGELEDLQVLSRAWGVPVATVVWAIVTEQLAKCRRRAPELGQAGLSIAAALVVLRQRLESERSGPPEDQRLESDMRPSGWREA
jgi:hypothetical protein